MAPVALLHMGRYLSSKEVRQVDLQPYGDNIIPVIPIDHVMHTEEMPFCFANPFCPCHEDHEEIQKVAAWVTDGLMTEEEALQFIAGRTF
jgi:hypothetical protein